MSHVTDVRLRIKDLDALSEACQQLGLQLHRGKESYRWYGRWMDDFNDDIAAVTNGHDPNTFGQCQHAISIQGDESSYEIGVLPAKDGDGYDLLYDSFDGKLEPLAGPKLSSLRKEYACAVATNRAKKTLGKRGWKTSREELQNGGVRIKLHRR